jgi:hypothetical protein
MGEEIVRVAFAREINGRRRISSEPTITESTLFANVCSRHWAKEVELGEYGPQI